MSEIVSVVKAQSYSQDWEIKSLEVTEAEWMELSNAERIVHYLEDSRRIFDILFLGVPDGTFQALANLFEAYVNPSSK